MIYIYIYIYIYNFARLHFIAVTLYFAWRCF